jgi:hypothetical protein
MFGVNEIMAAVALEQVGVTAYSLLNAVVNTVLIGVGVALVALGISRWLENGELFPVAMGGVFLTSVILLVFIERWGASNVLHLSRFLLWSPWTFIVGGVVGGVFYLILVAYSHSPNVEIGPISALIGFVVSLALITFGILGLFDFRFVRVAHTIAVGVPKITETISIFAGLIFSSVIFFLSIWGTLRELNKPAIERKNVGGWVIGTLIGGTLLVIGLLGIVEHFFR